MEMSTRKRTGKIRNRCESISMSAVFVVYYDHFVSLSNRIKIDNLFTSERNGTADNIKTLIASKTGHS